MPMPTKPTPAEVWQAIQLYLDLAYNGPPPTPVRSRLETLRSLDEKNFYENPVIERNDAENPTRYEIRLGNRCYPHMKLAIDLRPDQQGFLFRVDTHDRHCCPPPTSREYEAYCNLMRENQNLSQAIERAWEQHGLPTFKTYLRDDLARRAMD